jgi:hypothetical protein
MKMTNKATAKDNVRAGESFQVGSESVFESDNQGFGMHGHTKIYIQRASGAEELIKDDHNLIIGGAAQNGVLATVTGLKSYFAHSMSSDATTGAIDLLFATDSAADGEWSSATANTATYAGRDGIVIAATDGPVEQVFAMETEQMTAANTYGRKWKGTFEALVPNQFTLAVIGNNLKTNLTTASGGDPASGLQDVFTIPYAKQQFTTQLLGAGDTLIVEWEIYIA